MKKIGHLWLIKAARERQKQKSTTPEADAAMGWLLSTGHHIWPVCIWNEWVFGADSIMKLKQIFKVANYLHKQKMRIYAKNVCCILGLFIKI